MKIIQRLLIVVINIFFSTTVFAANLEGLWLAYDEDAKPTGYVRIVESKGVYQGLIEKGLVTDTQEKYCTACKDERKNQRLIGMTIIKGVVHQGNDRYQGTEILDPFSGNTYRVILKLKDAGQTLDVRGYVGVSLFGRTQIWKRVENGK